MHRAEQILAQLETTLTGLGQTGSNVKRTITYKHSTLPALSIQQGEDTVPEEGRNINQLTRVLTVFITAHVKNITTLETDLNAIRAEVFTALMADITQGLNFVISTELVHDGAPETEADQDQPTGRQLQIWRIIYRHSGTSTEV